MGATVLFVFAHEDDEIVYLGLMRHLSRENRDFRVVWLTDGAGTAPAGVRRSESTRTMKALGVGEDRLHFWEYPDGHSIDSAGEVIERLGGLMAEIGPSEVYAPAYEGGHPDHDFANAAAVMAAAGLEHPPAVFEAPLYNSYGSRHMVFSRFVPAETATIWTPMSSEDTRFKLRALFNYRSQLWITVVPILLFAWPRLLGPGEPYRPVPRWNYLQPPHEGKLCYEGFVFQRLLGLKYTDFRRALLGL